MDKVYEPGAIEQRWYREWEQRGYFAPQGHGTPYCIMIPPPNVTGTLHMGHAFQDTIMDALIRQHRMKGNATLWQMGTDHAGIATQMVVERQLNAAGRIAHQPRPRCLRAAGLGMEGTVRRHDLAAAATPGRVGGLDPRTFHHGSGAVRAQSPKSSCACTKRG